MTEQSDFRQAICVELYDAGVMLRLHDGGGFCEYDFPGFWVDGSTLERALQHLGIVSQSAGEFVKGKRKVGELRDWDGFVIHREARWFLDDSKTDVIAIAVRVLGPHLIDIRITLQNADGDPWTSEHTYAGAFAVEWLIDD